MRQPFLLICICALQVVSVMFSASSYAAEERWEDPSCQAVVRAFKRTMNYPSYSLERRLIKADGSDRPFVQAIITPTAMREKRSFEKDWRSSERSYAPDGPAWDRYKPVFTDCRRITPESNSEKDIERYSVRFATFPYRANLDVWIARDTKLLMRNVRNYLDDRWAFPEQRISTTFTYEELEAVSPAEFEAAPEVRNSCEQIKEMLGRFNSAEAVQADVQEIYMAKGEPSHSSVIIVGGKQYTRESGRRWYLTSRQSTRPEDISNCAFYGDQYLIGIATSVYGYEKMDIGNGRHRILSRVSKDTGLPIREYFITVDPDNGVERLISYSYDPELKKPE